MARLALFDLDNTLVDRPGAVMPGDDPAGDIGGWRAAGLRTIGLRGRSWLIDISTPHHTVDDV